MGVDQSLTSTGLAFRDVRGSVVTYTLKPEKLRALHRLSYIRKALLDVVQSVQPTLVVFEDYVMGFRKTTGRLAHLGELGGVLKLAVWEAGVDVMVVPSATLKSAIAADGKADKDKVMSTLASKYGYTINQEDEADALSLMLIGEHTCGSPELHLTAARKAAIDKCAIVAGQPKLGLKSIANRLS